MQIKTARVNASFKPFFTAVTESAVDGARLKIPVNGFGTDLLRGKFGVPSGLVLRLLVCLIGDSGGVFLGILEPLEPVFGDVSPC